MSDVTLSYHTHANGETFGWWGAAVHPAHYDAKEEPIPGTNWRREVHNCETLEEADRQLRTTIEGLAT